MHYQLLIHSAYGPIRVLWSRGRKIDLFRGADDSDSHELGDIELHNDVSDNQIFQTMANRAINWLLQDDAHIEIHGITSSKRQTVSLESLARDLNRL